MRKLFKLIVFLQGALQVLSQNRCTTGKNQSPINIDLEATSNSTEIMFQVDEFQSIKNATLIVNKDDGLIYFRNPNLSPSNMTVINQYGEKQLYHFSHAQWKVPSEHTIGGKKMSAEFQIYHSQFVTNKEVALSFLFDTSLVPVDADPRRLKTCFVDSFEMSYFKSLSDRGRPADVIEPPLREFIDFVPQTEMIFYEGSRTTSGCGEDITWIINLKPHVITEQQVQELMDILPQQAKSTGGNSRDVQMINDRKIYKFNNVENTALHKDRAIAEAEIEQKLAEKEEEIEFFEDSGYKPSDIFG